MESLFGLPISQLAHTARLISNGRGGVCDRGLSSGAISIRVAAMSTQVNLCEYPLRLDIATTGDADDRISGTAKCQHEAESIESPALTLVSHRAVGSRSCSARWARAGISSRA